MQYINRFQKSKSISGAAVCHRRGIAVYPQQSKPQAEALLMDTLVSTVPVYQPLELYISRNQKRRRKHRWSTRPCRPGRCINYNRQSKSISGAAVHITSVGTPAWYSCTSTAVYKTKAKAKTHPDDTAVSIGAVYQPRSAKQKHLWRSCISPAHSFNRDQSEIMSGAAVSTATKLKHVGATVSTRVMFQPR